MSFGSWLGGQIDIIGFIKALFAKVYALLFKDEIAKRDADEKATKDEVKGQLQVVKDAAGRIADAEGHKQAIEQQIQVEQRRQAADEQKAAEITHDKEVTDKAIASQSDDDALRSGL